MSSDKLDPRLIEGEDGYTRCARCRKIVSLRGLYQHLRSRRCVLEQTLEAPAAQKPCKRHGQLGHQHWAQCDAFDEGRRQAWREENW